MLADLPEGATDRKEELLSLARANMKVTRRLNDILTEFLRFARPPSPEFVVADLNRIVSETIRFLVITSYSIHYTKLYDGTLAPRLPELVAALHREVPSGVGSTGSRITSYNVCYTKLLRSS